MTKPPHFSVPDVIKEIGEQVWSYDTSFAHDLNGNTLPPLDEAYVKKTLKQGFPMTVHTHPVLREFKIEFIDEINSEYFIAVTIPGLAYQFYVLNCKSSLLGSYGEMIEWLGPDGYDF